MNLEKQRQADSTAPLSTMLFKLILPIAECLESDYLAWKCEITSQFQITCK